MMDIKQHQQKLIKQESGISVNEQVAEELDTPVIKKDKKKTKYKIVNESNCKPNKLWVDQVREFYNKLKQECLGNIDTDINVPYT